MSQRHSVRSMVLSGFVVLAGCGPQRNGAHNGNTELQQAATRGGVISATPVSTKTDAVADDSATTNTAAKPASPEVKANYEPIPASGADGKSAAGGATTEVVLSEDPYAHLPTMHDNPASTPTPPTPAQSAPTPTAIVASTPQAVTTATPVVDTTLSTGSDSANVTAAPPADAGAASLAAAPGAAAPQASPPPGATAAPTQCVAAYPNPEPDWYPGLPNPPFNEPLTTDKEDPKHPGVLYTDSRQDGLMAMLVDQASALPGALQENSRTFSKTIRNLQVRTDTAHTGLVKVRLQYIAGADHHTVTVDLRGQMEGQQHQHRTAVKLVEIPQASAAAAKTDKTKPLDITFGSKASATAPPSHPKFSGVLTCADVDHGCKSVLLRLDLHGKSGKIVVSAFALHRWGTAHLTLTDSDRTQFASYVNTSYSAVAEFLSNSVNNACLSLRAEAKAGRRALESCTLAKLTADCSGEEAKSPAADTLGLRSWAVAYGRSGFEVVMAAEKTDGGLDFDNKLTNALVISGPLVHTAQRPMLGHELTLQSSTFTSSGSSKGKIAITHDYINDIASVYLINNDGGGNLNFQVHFKQKANEQEASTRLSVTGVLPNTQFVKSPIERAHLIPTPNVSETAQAETGDLP